MTGETVRSKSPYGPLIVDGVVQYTSSSQLSGVDPADSGCLRKWHWEKIAGMKPPPKASATLGTNVHAEIEAYLHTGANTLGPLASAARHLIPTPKYDGGQLGAEASGLLVEQEIGDAWRVTADGTRVVGRIDLLNLSGFYLTGDGDQIDEPYPEVIDWKTTSSVDWIKTPIEVSRTIPMTAYGLYAARTHSSPRVRLSHVYTITKGKPQAIKRTRLVETEDMIERWEYTRPLMRSIRDVAKVPADQSNTVDANPNACTAYGGCPHRAYCTPPVRHNSLADIFGASMSSKITGEPRMSLLDRLKVTSSAAAAPAQTPTTPTVSLNVAAQVAALAAQEAAPPPAPPKQKSAFHKAWDQLVEQGWGTPRMEGDAAIALSPVFNRAPSDTPFTGSGRLAEVTINDPSVLIQLAGEVANAAAAERAQGVAVAAMAPAAAAPVVFTPPTAPAVPQPVTYQAANPLLPPDAPASNPALAADPVPGFGGTPATDTTTPVASAPRNKGGRPKKTPAPEPTVAITSPIDVDAQQSDGISVFVDCTPTGINTQPLEPQIAAWVAEICKATHTRDIRTAPSKDSPLAFAGWRGVLAAAAREMPIAPGAYTLDTRNDFSAVVAEAIIARAAFYVRSDR